MELMRKIIDWCDEKMDESYAELDQAKANKKAFVAGFVEGACDGALLMYVPLLVSCYIWQYKAAKK